MYVITPLKSNTFLLYLLLLPGHYSIALISIALSRDAFISQRQKHSSTIVVSGKLENILWNDVQGSDITAVIL